MAVGVGCHCSGHHCVPPAQTAPCSYEYAAPEIAAPNLTASVLIDRDAALCFPCQLPSPGDEYRSIDAQQCQCNAATNVSVGRMLELERHWAGVLICCENDATSTALSLTRDLLTLHESEVRNTAAASALTTFYLLAGAEAQLRYLQLGIDEAVKTIERLDNLRERGIEPPDGLNRSDVSIRLSDLEDKQLQLGLLRIQLNGQLMQLLGCPLDEEGFFQPRVDWQCELSRPNFETLVAQGMANRADVRSVRLALCRLEPVTVPVARAVLAVADSTLGRVEPGRGVAHALHCGCTAEEEVRVRRHQLCALMEEARELAVAKVKSAAYRVSVQQQRVALARDAVLARRKSLDDLQKLRDINETSVFEISLARGALFEAEATLVEQVVELKVSEVALKEAQGLLAVECGHGAVLTCEPQPTYTSDMEETTIMQPAEL